MRNLKYQEKIDDKCNLSIYTEKETLAYRWVFSDIEDERNFLPPYIRNPNRTNDNCRVWCLSFFDSLENAKKRLAEITKHNKNLYKKLGTHVAEGELEKEDGIISEVDSQGHFGMFEYVKTDLTEKFQVIGSSR